MTFTNRSFLIILTTLLLNTGSWAVVFYSNPEDLSEYVGNGLYPENRYSKKIPLNSNWQFRLEGDNDWNDIYIPSCYDGFDPEKKIYFRTSFFIGGKKSLQRSYKLVFYGVNYKCNVKVNGVFIENHSSPNGFEISLNKDDLNFSETNTLVLEVNNKLTSTTIPSLMQVDGWRNYGGIFRDVFLIINSQIYISDTDIKYYFNSDYTKVNAEIISEITDNNFISISDDDTISYKNMIYSYFEITDLGSKKVIHRSEKKNIEIKRYRNDQIKFNFEMNEPKLWSPEEPNLYLVSVYLGSTDEMESEQDFHRYDITFGFRELKITDNKFMLNGQNFYLKGVSRYEDIRGMGNSITYSMMKKEIEKIKNLGSNIIYCNAYAPHPYLIDLCDKFGIFVLQEIPVNSAPAVSLRDRDFVERAINILEETVKRDGDRPSLFGVGLGSGYNVYDLQTVDFIKDLSDKSKELNDDLFTFITSEFTEYDEYYKLTDFNIISISSNTLDPDFKTSIANISRKGLFKPVIANNKLTRVYPGNQNGYSDPYGEPSQAKQLMESYSFVTEDENIAGIIIDSFRDRRSDVSLLTNKPEDDLYIIRNGLIDYEGNERLSYRFLDALFKTRRTPAIAQGEYTEPEVNIYFIIGLFLTVLYLYMIKREHYLFVNSIRSIKNPDAFFIDIRDRRITQVLQALFVGAMSAYGISAVISTVFYSFRQNEKFDFFLTYFIRNDILKKFLTFSSWEPMIFIISSTILTLAFFIIISFFVKTVSVFFNHRFSLSVSISMILWNSIVFLPLVPLSAVFLRIFSPLSVKIVLLIFAMMILWFTARLFLIMSVSFKSGLSRVIWVNLGIISGIGLLWLYFFEFNTDRFSYLFYLIDLLVR